MATPFLKIGFAALSLVLAIAASASGQSVERPEPNPPWLDGGSPVEGSGLTQAAPRQQALAPTEEWLLHKTADGLHPDGNEQALMWFMNWARQDPAAEGVWLATESHPDVANGRTSFGVDLGVLEAEFDAIAPGPPGAFDRRLYEASLAHSLDLITRDAQDHDQQFNRVGAAGFSHAGGRASVFSFTRSALNGHAVLNIDLGGNDGTGMQTGRGHRAAIMGDYTNIGIAMVAENNPSTSVGPLVTSAVYVYANSGAEDHYNRFLVGTVWEDADGNGFYDPGEGFDGVSVRPAQGSFFAVTSKSGGYSIPILASGSYDVTFSGGELGGNHHRTVVFGADSELLDLVPVPEPSSSALGTTALLATGILSGLRRRAGIRFECPETG